MGVEVLLVCVEGIKRVVVELAFVLVVVHICYIYYYHSNRDSKGEAKEKWIKTR